MRFLYRARTLSDRARGSGALTSSIFHCIGFFLMYPSLWAAETSLIQRWSNVLGYFFLSSLSASHFHRPLILRLLSLLSLATILRASLLQRLHMRKEVCFVFFYCFYLQPWISLAHLPMTPRRCVLEGPALSSCPFVRLFIDLGTYPFLSMPLISLFHLPCTNREPTFSFFYLSLLMITWLLDSLKWLSWSAFIKSFFQQSIGLFFIFIWPQLSFL
jgi:hypothetical protein